MLAAALVAGTAAWMTWAQHDLVLSHYDAKAHLVVARRVFDNITPGWKQIGAVWLPLPHLLHMLPTQIDVLYRTGAFGSFLSVISFALTVWAAARLVLAMTGSHAGAITAGALLLLNPNLLYLQSTPMTEPLLLGVTFLLVLWMYEWLAAERPGETAGADPHRPPVRIGWALLAAAWTRYEAWPVVAAILCAVTYALWRRGLAGRYIARTIARLAAWPAAAILLFLVNSRITAGTWFVSGGFYEHDPGYEGLVLRSLLAVWWGTHRLSGYLIEIVALVTAGAVLVGSLKRRSPDAWLAPVALFAAASLPFYAFYAGHPFRVRYMVPLVGACALFCGLAVALIGRVSPGASGRSRAVRAPLAAALLVASSLVESPPLEGRAPMLEEAQWDVPRSRERRAVTACLADAYHGEKVMASMGSLAHYMQELSHDGFDIADFVHEGNGTIWDLAMETGPAPHAGWMLIEEQSEGGDVLARRVREDAAFTRGMVRVCEGGGVVLYQRK
jgi:hypothetical protein